MNSSRPSVPRQVPAPPQSRAGNAYTRFIPREELPAFAAWTPHVLSPSATAGPAPPVLAPERRAQSRGPLDEQAEQVHAARQSGYQDGYRDGLVALESFKQGYARQVTAQISAVVQSLQEQLLALEHDMAASLARCATQLARQVVRSEISTRPALVAQVASEAVEAVLTSARHIRIALHADDLALVAEGAAELLAARGVRLELQADIARGGCRVQSDAGTVDARIATRWLQATQALDTGVGWAAADGPDGADPAP